MLFFPLFFLPPPFPSFIYYFCLLFYIWRPFFFLSCTGIERRKERWRVSRVFDVIRHLVLSVLRDIFVVDVDFWRHFHHKRTVSIRFYFRRRRVAFWFFISLVSISFLAGPSWNCEEGNKSFSYWCFFFFFIRCRRARRFQRRWSTSKSSCHLSFFQLDIQLIFIGKILFSRLISLALPNVREKQHTHRISGNMCVGIGASTRLLIKKRILREISSNSFLMCWWFFSSSVSVAFSSIFIIMVVSVSLCATERWSIEQVLKWTNRNDTLCSTV